MLDHILESIKTYYLDWLPFNKSWGSPLKNWITKPVPPE